jgi:tetratricopeptide (TPR) repeat protein
LILPLFIQGCGLAGAYIHFGDRAWENYRIARKDHLDEEAKEYLKNALDNYRSSLTYDETRYPVVYSKLAEAEYIYSKNVRKALNWLKLGLSHLPEDPVLLAQQGKFTFFHARENSSIQLLNQAKDDFKVALLKSPLDPMTNAGLMKVYFYEISRNILEGNESRNRYLFSQVEDLMENVEGSLSPHVLEAMGINAYLKKDYKNAIESLTEVIKLNDPEFDGKRTQFYLARSYVETRQYKEAIELTNELLEIYPDDPEIMGERILAFYRKGEKSAASLELNSLEKMAPNYHQFYYRLGKFFYEQNLGEKAKLYLLRAYRLHSENGRYAYALGENYLLQGDRDSARKFYLKAQQLAAPSSDLEKDSQQKITEIGR